MKPSSFTAILGILLLYFSGTASAFTIIELNPESTPSSSVTDSTTLNTELQPVTSAIQSHLRDATRRDRSSQSARQDNLYASNSYAETMSDADFIKVSGHGGSGGGGQRSLWLSTSFTAMDNDFSRTKYDGGMHMLMVGFDYTMNDRYIFGVALSHEASDIDTVFNTGNLETSGISVNPYFAYLISDSWSLDLSLGFGDFDTEQFRTIAVLDLLSPTLTNLQSVDSDYSTERDFVASNLTYSAPRGNWYLTGWLGFLKAEKDQDSYTESDDTRVKGEELDIERWSLGGEAAYQHIASETYVGLLYEKESDFNDVEFAFGEQPANDDDSMLLSVGWRYYGDDIVANFEFSSRLGVDDINENTISSTLRIDL